VGEDGKYRVEAYLGDLPVPLLGAPVERRFHPEPDDETILNEPRLQTWLLAQTHPHVAHLGPTRAGEVWGQICPGGDEILQNDWLDRLEARC
jgi:hypothetical protein